jgi:hypothetical protein
MLAYIPYMDPMGLDNIQLKPYDLYDSHLHDLDNS